MRNFFVGRTVNYDHQPKNTGESWMRLCHTFRKSMTGRIAPAHAELSLL
jgi:hypothetical protein